MTKAASKVECVGDAVPVRASCGWMPWRGCVMPERSESPAMASDPRIEAVADAMRRLDGEPEAPLVSYGDDARFVLAAADAADPLRDRDRMLKAIEDGYERIVRAGFAFTTGEGCSMRSRRQAMNDRPRTWEIGVFSRAPQVGPAIAGPHPGDNEWVRVVEAAPVIAALHQIEAAIHIGKGLALHEVQELRRAVSDE